MNKIYSWKETIIWKKAHQRRRRRGGVGRRKKSFIFRKRGIEAFRFVGRHSIHIGSISTVSIAVFNIPTMCRLEWYVHPFGRGLIRSTLRWLRCPLCTLCRVSSALIGPVEPVRSVGSVGSVGSGEAGLLLRLCSLESPALAIEHCWVDGDRWQSELSQLSKVAQISCRLHTLVVHLLKLILEILIGE